MGAEVEDLVRRAAKREVAAFVALTRRFQHMAFASALALVRDFATAEDVVQEAFLAAWSALPGLDEPAAFPTWLRSIVRHQAFRVLRRSTLQAVPLSEAEDIASDAPPVDHALEERQRAATALAAVAGLPDALREAATLYYVHDCSHQDIATFLGLTPAVVNNRLHAARSLLKERMLTMVEETLHSQGLPADFANRIGRLVEARGAVVEALFDPESLPDILAELAVSDEAEGRAVSVQVVQRPGGGLVRAVAVQPIGPLPRGATVMSEGRHAESALSANDFARIVPMLVGTSPLASGEARLLETGIKAIDVLSPLAAGGSVALAGEAGTGLMVLMEELAHRLSGGGDDVSLVVLMPPQETWPERKDGNTYSYAEALKKDGFGEGTKGSVQTFFLRGQDTPWTDDTLPTLDQVDTVIHLSRTLAAANIWPAIEPVSSRSRLFETAAVSKRHLRIAEDVRAALAKLAAAGDAAKAGEPVELQRARKLRNYFAQPFYVAEAFSKRPGVHVPLAEALRDCEAILAGKHDDLSADAFCFTGSMAEIRKP